MNFFFSFFNFSNLKFKYSQIFDEYYLIDSSDYNNDDDDDDDDDYDYDYDHYCFNIHLSIFSFLFFFLSFLTNSVSLNRYFDKL